MGAEPDFDIRVDYHEVPLKNVLASYASNLIPKDESERVVRFEPLIDTIQGKVLFRLYLQRPKDAPVVQTFVQPKPVAVANPPPGVKRTPENPEPPDITKTL